MAGTNQIDDKLPLENEELARQLDELADLLEGEDANPFRVRAYRVGAQRLRELKQPAHEILQSEGRKGLMAVPGIGAGLAHHIERLAASGHLQLLDELRGEAGAEAVLCTVVGIGPELARRIYRELKISTLEELEQAAHDGRLAQVPGLGPRRVRAIRECLAARLGRHPRISDRSRQAVDQPDVVELLDLDRQYREQATAGLLRTIAPRRFNPGGEAWLPVLHTQRSSRHYTVLFSNTPLAHQQGMTRDWVVIYRKDAGAEGQWTVVTARTGSLRGRRVVRGREQECAAYYAAQETSAETPARLF